jgi:class 3 adenylate cyclase
MTAMAVCRTCGTEPLEHARFCHGCGSPVEDAGIRAEYKQVTVLFADVVRSMDLAAAVGAERLREIMADLARRFLFAGPGLDEGCSHGGFELASSGR